MAQDDAACVCDLVVKELTEVLLIHFAFFGIHNRCEPIQFSGFDAEILHSADHIAQFADSGRLDQDAVRVILFQNLTQCLAEISDQ